ncbi:uncharacterized protein TRIADDRAFT_61761 [Trichoplax adhaerens]|uniref:FANCI solenoid 4 domain-containing protein n=1 Tax=Trichoplax adhaerens TaxID=10228 RepID=B3SBW6_TRIAD|nr:hypothetical protein TRIADDRAFT_61761 [Trichoplax adhaerens]EDV19704.1 hypothetical protein TRIADDRAFT_61761 [Trichoplax adhaerens]|eukprot:XP_002117728.1 hypothetical protein TRIADDRAFT_61761 [Trichoplax adhaerens]
MNSSSFLLKCFAEGNQDAVLKSVNCLNEKQLCNLIDGHHPQTCELMQVILKALITDKNEGFQKHDFVVKHCVSLINEGQMPQKVLAGMVSYLLVQSLALISEPFRIFLLFKSDICTAMSGPQYKAYILNKLCSSRWHASCIVSMASMFRGIDMSEEELRVVVEKMILTLPSIDILELPPLVYQLLLMSNQGFKRTILAGIISYMTSLNLQIRKEQEASNEIVAISDKQLQPLEGTVILHMTYAIKQDQDLGKELIKYFKENSNTSSSFRLALSLAVARISRFHDLIFDILKSSIIKAYKDNERFNSCRWLRDSSRTPLTIEKATLKVIENSSLGWDQVTQGMLELGFILVDGFLVKIQPAQLQVSRLGTTIILKCFKVHDAMREEILEQIINRIISKGIATVTNYIGRSIEARKIAAFGMTVLLKAYKVHIHSQTGSKLNHKWVKSEILRHLQRCLSHQASVKEILYKGFYQTVSIATELQKLVYNILMKQDKEADFSPVTAAGCRNLILCKLIANLYEVLIEFMLRKNDFAIGDCEDATRLFERYSRITQILRENGNNPHVRSVKSKYRLETMISFSCVSTLIRIIFGLEVVALIIWRYFNIAKQSGGILDEQINNQDEMIYALVAFFQKLINSALTAGAEFKQAHIAMTIILSLLQHLGESGLKQLLTVSIDIHGQLGDVEEVILSSQLEAAMENIDWLVSNLNALIFDDDIGEAEFSRTYSEMEATVCSRLTMVAQCLQEIIESAIPTKTCTECSVKGVTRLYTSMTFLVKHYMQLFMRRRVTVSERFENLVKLSGLQVTPKAVRESRVIPNLIYAIEMYEAHLIRLEAKLQVNLMQYFKRSTSRDFKIHGATLQTIIDDDSDDSYEVPMEYNYIIQQLSFNYFMFVTALDIYL